MKQKKQIITSLTLKPSFFVVSFGLFFSSSLLATDAPLKDPKVRQALQRLIKSYQTPAVSAPEQEPELTDHADSSLSTLPKEEQNEPSFHELSFVEQSMDGSRFMEGDELILKVEIGSELSRYSLADVFAFKSKASIKVGFLTLAQLLELPIQSNQGFTAISGWFFNEKNSFELTQLPQNTTLQVRVNGTQEVIEQGSYQLESDDIYIELEIVAKWLGLKYTIDESRLVLALTSERQLPVELSIARRSRQAYTPSKVVGAVMPLKNTDYQLFSPPLLDVQVNTQHKNDTTVAAYSLSSSQDLAYFTSKFYASGGRGDLVQDARLTLSRESEENNLLGVLKATEYEFGDVYSQGSGGVGRGFRVSNTPLLQSLDGRSVTFVGEVTDGWDVELYRNGLLLAQKFAVSDGRYEFSDITLDYGVNNFELVFYGPQGQVEKRSESYNLADNFFRPNEFFYQFSTVDSGRTLLDVKKEEELQAQSGLNTHLGLGYGVTQWLGLNSSFTLAELDGEESELSRQIGANISLFNLGYLSLSHSDVENKRQGSNYQFSSQLFSQSISIGHSASKSLLSEAPHEDITQSNFKVSGQLFPSSSYGFSHAHEWSKDSFDDRTLERFRNSLGVTTRFGGFNHDFTWAKQRFHALANGTSTLPSSFFDNSLGSDFLDWDDVNYLLSDRAERVAAGSLQYRNKFDAVFARFYLNYALKPEKELSSYGVHLNYPFSQDLTSSFQLNRLHQTGDISSRLGINWHLESAYLSAITYYTSRSGWSFGMNLRFGLGVSDGDYFTSSRAISHSGAVTARVFEDKNLNGMKDEGEPFIEGAEVLAPQAGFRRAKSNKEGLAVLTMLPSLHTTDIVVNRASFEDPTMKTLSNGSSIKVRKGKLEHFDFAATTTGELEGTLYLEESHGNEVPAAYALIQLIDEYGQVAATTQSEFDGYYLFVDVIPGKYKIKVDEKYSSRRGVRSSEPLYFAVRGGEVINGDELLLKSRQEMQGFASELGQFKSMLLLKVYWRLVGRSGMNVARLNAFYLRNETTGEYTLWAGFSPNASEASKVCERLNSRNFNCEVKALSLNI